MLITAMFCNLCISCAA
uniref:Uncharacterized protein n=1 Tax=Arundo donax TaxID=35708 RepID=A0A0A8ZUM3_ARUDO